MKNPLIKRIPKELKQEWGKYCVIFVFMIATIGFISGFLVADQSMRTAYDNSFTDYNIEDGDFELMNEAGEQLIDQIENLGVKIYDNNYIEAEVLEDKKLRIFSNRGEVNLICVLDGRLPENQNEIAIDRLYAENNELDIGDTITISAQEFTITGMVAFSDYSALFSNNADMMFDASEFGVGVVTDQGFDLLNGTYLHYNYSWKYTDTGLTDKEKRAVEDDLKAYLATNATIMNFIPQEENQAIQFAGEDMGSDKMMITILLYIIIVILAFTFGITISNTIEKESSVIGTLRASGYTRVELVVHYLTLPVFVTFVAAVLGNILGYTYMKDAIAALYYHSYSLTIYQTIWNSEAFINTTLIPCLIMIVVNLFVLLHYLKLSPIQFLRHDLTKNQKHRAIQLPNFRFISRFRLRVILQNLPNYIILFLGIIFANVLLLFGLMMTPLLDHYSTEVEDNLVCEYQYILKTPVETSMKNAEKYCVKSLQTDIKNSDHSEEITVYGIEENTSYLRGLSILDGEEGVYVSNGVLEKYDLSIGDMVYLKDKYEDNRYELKIIGSYDYPAALAIFMNKDVYNDLFDQDSEYFNGYFSDEKLTDVNDKMIASVITQEDMNKIVRQLKDSMGAMFPMINGFSILLFMLIIYLLSKIIIEKNSAAIAMVKILGYQNGEIAWLYIAATSIVVILELLLSMPIAYGVLKILYSAIMSSYTGWITFYINPLVYIKMFALGIGSYFFIAMLQFQKIKKVPKEEALKNAEF